ncbi:putative methyltransferase TARBP1-like protein [Dinothrombium tinctorium]|uniref:tRNA (guanosine(18)-2'-O)-methyltransferase TARBP1 n=1 Tax=Dinothrombium tinctorium TaxID=1965070 RepID=A0A3S3Q4P5_9ACAR|nr:putative methyltransferase TARBP1-like protein [Dinothrombium tinctorium]
MSVFKLFLDYISSENSAEFGFDPNSSDVRTLAFVLDSLKESDVCDRELDVICRNLIVAINSLLRKAETNADYMFSKDELFCIKQCVHFCSKRNAYLFDACDQLINCKINTTTKVELIAFVLHIPIESTVGEKCVRFLLDVLRTNLSIDSEHTKLVSLVINVIFELSVIKFRELKNNLIAEIISLLNEINLSIEQFHCAELLDFITSLLCFEENDFCVSVADTLSSLSNIELFLLDNLIAKNSGLMRKKARFCAAKLNLINFDIWLLLEALEEKQKHLIEPLLTKLNLDLVKNVKTVDRSLMEILIERMLFHDNKQIKRHAVAFVSNNAFDLKFEISKKFLLETCIFHLQDNNIYGSSEPHFTLNFLLLLPVADIIQRLLQLESEGHLSPIALYHIFKKISEDSENRTEEKTGKEIIRKMIVAIFHVCSDVCVRASIQFYLLKTFVKRCPKNVIDLLSFIDEKEVNLAKALDEEQIEKISIDIDHCLNTLSNESIRMIARYFAVRYEICKDESIFYKINEATKEMDSKSIELFYPQMLEVVLSIDTPLWKIIKCNASSALSNLSKFLIKKNLPHDVANDLIIALKSNLNSQIVSWDSMATICELLGKHEHVEIRDIICSIIDLWLRLNKSLLCFREEPFWICLLFFAKCSPTFSFTKMSRILEPTSQFDPSDRDQIKEALFSLVSIVPSSLNRYVIKFYGLLLRNELLQEQEKKLEMRHIISLFLPLCDYLFTACLELKKNEYFRETILCYIIEFAFREELFLFKSIEVNNEQDHRLSQLYQLEIKDISALLINHLARILSQHSQNIRFNANLELLLKVVIDGLIFTRNAGNQIDVIAKEIGENANVSNCLLVENPFNYHHNTRIFALEAALSLTRYETLLRLMHLLIDEENKVLQETSYSFLNSNLHRRQTKIWQFHLILLYQMLNSSAEDIRSHIKEWASLMFSYTVECLINQQRSQMSVQILQQLILISLLLNSTTSDFVWPHFYEVLQFDSEEQLQRDNGKKLNSSRIGSLVPFLSIVFHLINTHPHLKFFPISCLLTCQHYKVRLLSHLVLQKASTLIDISSNSYKFLTSPIPRGSANVNRNLDKLKSDWFYSLFDPLTDITLDFILHYLPKLTNCMQEDIIPLSVINSKIFNIKLNFSLSNAKSVLREAKSSALKEKFFDETFNDGSHEKNSQLFQKKYSVPQTYSSNSRDTDEEGLVVCATLLDRAPNLGGLCRTCEVFGARKLVIGNASVLNDKDFVQLSVSAQKWVNIKEVKKCDLLRYLTTMRRDFGYTLIGIEQTTGSKMLNQYKFPKKSLVVLGNEKEGLPVEYLQQLDVCIEIPQSGFIRSLNVHVTGAIIIWEYYKQMSSDAALNKSSS